ncbi:unnamed protein product [Toxocara canis]|uniref:Secreted protein n=1 Tax=Toxocara canis TaxID=6265 RepID=A0A183VHC0_TOXCA|nr:unnamed protein product [Toxocara canis]
MRTEVMGTHIVLLVLATRTTERRVRCGGCASKIFAFGRFEIGVGAVENFSGPPTVPRYAEDFGKRSGCCRYARPYVRRFIGYGFWDSMKAASRVFFDF